MGEICSAPGSFHRCHPRVWLLGGQRGSGGAREAPGGTGAAFPSISELWDPRGARGAAGWVRAAVPGCSSFPTPAPGCWKSPRVSSLARGRTTSLGPFCWAEWAAWVQNPDPNPAPNPAGNGLSRPPERPRGTGGHSSETPKCCAGLRDTARRAPSSTPDLLGLRGNAGFCSIPLLALGQSRFSRGSLSVPVCPFSVKGSWGSPCPHFALN